MEKVEHGGKSHKGHGGEKRPEWGLGKANCGVCWERPLSLTLKECSKLLERFPKVGIFAFLFMQGTRLDTSESSKLKELIFPFPPRRWRL